MARLAPSILLLALTYVAIVVEGFHTVTVPQVFSPSSTAASLRSRQKVAVAAVVHRHKFFSSSFTSALSMADEDEKDDSTSTSTKNSKTACLNLVGKVTHTSSVAPTPGSVSPADVRTFFSDPAHRNICIAGANDNRVESVKDAAAELYDLWEVQARSLGGAMPNSSDAILKAYTPGIQFPGLKVTTVATFGCKLIAGEESSYPSYEFVLITSVQEAGGLPPVVWIFNKLTGRNEENDDVDSESAKSMSRVTVDPTPDGKGVTFTCDAQLEIGVKFPAVLLKILPGANLEKAEARGGAAIQKALEKDVGPAVDNFKTAFANWVVAVK